MSSWLQFIQNNDCITDECITVLMCILWRRKKTCYSVCYTFFFSVSLAYLRKNKSVCNNSCLSGFCFACLVCLILDIHLCGRQLAFFPLYSIWSWTLDPWQSCACTRLVIKGCGVWSPHGPSLWCLICFWFTKGHSGWHCCLAAWRLHVSKWSVMNWWHIVEGVILALPYDSCQRPQKTPVTMR